MKITYKNTFEDILNLHMDTLNNDPLAKKRILYMQIFLPVLIMAIYFLAFYKYKYSSILFIFDSLVSLGWIIYYPEIFQWKVKKIFTKRINDPKNHNLFTYQSLTLTEEGITKERKGELSKFSWDTIKNIDVKSTYIYINATNAIVIPLSAFKDEAEKKEFLDILYKHIK